MDWSEVEPEKNLLFEAKKGESLKRKAATNRQRGLRVPFGLFCQFGWNFLENKRQLFSLVGGRKDRVCSNTERCIWPPLLLLKAKKKLRASSRNRDMAEGGGGKGLERPWKARERDWPEPCYRGGGRPGEDSGQCL